MDLFFFTVEDILQIHDDQIAQYGGEPTLRDRGLLESALETPRSMFGGEYLHRDIFEMAAAYLYHIVRNHPFVDGNKRTGTVAAFSFLEINNIDVEADENAVVEMTLAVATGQATKQQVAAFLREHAIYRES
ncbi:MAG: type II toxin-antitoxin system death-on-curing family toxin [Phycisphaerales bacterium]